MTKSVATTTATAKKSVLGSRNASFKEKGVCATALAANTPSWVTKVADAVEGMAWNIPALNRPRNYRYFVEQPVPEDDFTFTITKGSQYAFAFADGREDTGEEGIGNLTGNWDQNYGSNYQYGWDLLSFFAVTVAQVGGRITIEARLATSPLELASYLLDNDIAIRDVDQ